jgi:hypothetical protein
MDSTPETSDQRHYSNMLRRLRKFREGSETLHDLIDGLQTAFDHLQAAAQPWNDEFHGLWSELEFTHAECLQRQSGLSSDDYARVIAVAETMEAMVLSARTWSEVELQTLHAIVNNQRPELLPDLESGLRSGFTSKHVREIRDALRDEIVENGMTAGKINQWGEACEDFMWRIEPPRSQELRQ